MNQGKTIIAGAGPAGLTAAHLLVRRGGRPLVLEQRDRVGGIACTEEYKGFLFDMGGHRFFSRHTAPREIWQEVLAGDFLTRERLSRIYYRGKFFDYPLRAWNALAGIGPAGALAVAGSYLRWRIFPHEKVETFEQWVTNRFGRKLFNTFFKSYTEKVWGIPCSELQAEWAAQRIRDLSLRKAILGMFSRDQQEVRTLIDSFNYPRRGPGMLWEAMRRSVENGGGVVRLGARVESVRHHDGRVTGVTVAADGSMEEVPAAHLISSMPVTSLVRRLDPPAPPPVLQAAGRLKYRDFLTVCLIVDRADIFPDQWIYVHDPDVRMGRIQNYRNWSPEMCPDPGRTGLGLEYFCDKGDDLWSMPDSELVALGTRELDTMGLVPAELVRDATVYRVPKAYPVYDAGYADALQIIRRHLEGYQNLQTIGRNGLFRYNNMDHSMLTAMVAVERLQGNGAGDAWSVNDDQTYHEAAPQENGDEAMTRALETVFQRLDSVALGGAFAVLGSALVFLLTVMQLIFGAGGEFVALDLLGQYLPGFRVSAFGAALGLFYGGVVGYALGWSAATMRNIVTALVWMGLGFKTGRPFGGTFLDYI
jgi:protoporphyrinogen oxidase